MYSVEQLVAHHVYLRVKNGGQSGQRTLANVALKSKLQTYRPHCCQWRTWVNCGAWWPILKRISRVIIGFVE